MRGGACRCHVFHHGQHRSQLHGGQTSWWSTSWRSTQVKQYVVRQFTKILAGRVSVKDFVFAKEVRLGTYADQHTLPPAAVVASEAMSLDPRCVLGVLGVCFGVYMRVCDVLCMCIWWTWWRTYWKRHTIPHIFVYTILMLFSTTCAVQSPCLIVLVYTP